MERIIVVGSGASAVHFTLSVLRKGYEVLMLDVGHQKPEPVKPYHSFNDLKDRLTDPVQYFLGERFEGVLYPSTKKEYYGIPPSKNYVFSALDDGAIEATGFAPVLSFARGGLGEAWTGGVYPYNDDELSDFAFGYNEIAPFYAEISRRIGIGGVKDDLSRFMPVHDGLSDPLDLDEHSNVLLAEYRKHKEFMNGRHKCYFGRSRVAALSKSKDGRENCGYLGRCLWGCPIQAFYTPSITLNECKRYPNFQYCSDMQVLHFSFDSNHRIDRVVARSLKDERNVELPVQKLVLAAGTLCSSKIFLDSIFQASGEVIKLTGFMDNQQVLIPFVNLKMLGKPFNAQTYQYQQLAFGLECESPKDYLHGIVTTLKTALIHPIIQKIPLDVKTSTFIFRNLHAALGLVNLNFPDSRHEANYISLEPGRNTQSPNLSINYSHGVRKTDYINEAIKRVKRVLWKLKCIVPPGMVHVRPMGASVHYAGTIPMSIEKRPYTTSKYCQSHDFENLYIVDGATFPFLPAKNITFTLMANAARVAECAF